MKPIGIHKHYELVDENDVVIYEAPTIKALAQVSGFSDKAVRRGILKRNNWVVIKVEYIIFDEDEIHDVTETERSRLKRVLEQWKKEHKLRKALYKKALYKKAVKSSTSRAIIG